MRKLWQCHLIRIYLLLYASFQMMHNPTTSQLATLGSSFRLLDGNKFDDSESSIERLMEYLSCGADKSCFYMGRLEKNGEFIPIRSGDESSNNDIEFSAIWTKEPHELTNIALNKKTDASSMKANSKYVVDGNRGTRFVGDNCFKSENTTTEWWKVDLGNEALIDSISITNSGSEHEQYSKQLTNFDIRIGYNDRSGVNPTCKKNITISEPITVNFVCEAEMTGRYVFIEKRYQLILCEVQVFGIFVK